MEAVILAGGRGTRLSSVVPDLPKPLALVAGRPFLDHLLERLYHGGITHICLSVGYLAEKIVARYGQSFSGMKISYAHETTPLGTGGAIRFAAEFLTAPNILALNGDTIAEVDFKALQRTHQQMQRQLTLTLTQVPDVFRYGAVETDNGTVTRFSEKGTYGPGHINAGVYMLCRDLFQQWPMPEAFSFEADLLTPHLSDIRPAAHLASGYFIDIGVPEDYARAQAELS